MSNNNATTNCGPMSDKNEDLEPEIIIHVAMGMVTLLSVCGVLGNALAIFVFSRQRNKLSSTIFILALAVTDFITSLVTMPYTVVMELMQYNIGYDFPCKLYQFMKTTTIPFSAFVMVTIALDRYLCIVYPFKHIMTLKKAKIVVTVLSVLAFVIGLLASLMIGTYHLETTCPEKLTDGIHYTNNLADNLTVGENLSNSTLDLIEKPSLSIVHSGVCKASFLIFEKSFMTIYQRIYSALFGVCAVLVVILYGLTYKSVLTHRSKRLNISNRCCGMLSNNMADEHTEFTTLNKEENSAIGNGREEESCIQLEDKYRERTETVVSNVTNFSGNALKPEQDRQPRTSGGISRAKLKKLRVANIKTALMLSIVAFMYIIAFTPAWMMALGVIDMNVIIYYLYFTYNVANPVIYAFLNNNFRTHLQAMFRCKQ